MSFTDLFSEKADRYAQARPTYPDALFAFLASQAPARQAAWDCATGSGQAARGLARHFRRVEATDASESQIANAVEHPEVRYSVQPAESTTFPSASFDAVCVAQALHWFDLDRFYAEARRVLRDRGVLMVCGYTGMEVGAAFDAEFDRRVLADLEAFWPPQNAELVAGYRDVPFPFERIDAPPLAIELRWTLRQLLDYVGTWTATRRRIAEVEPGFIERAGGEVASTWGEHEVRRVVMPLAVLCGRHRVGS